VPSKSSTVFFQPFDSSEAAVEMFTGPTIMKSKAKNKRIVRVLRKQLHNLATSKYKIQIAIQREYIKVRAIIGER
tara:strand:- start:487 stop:711 length:225 start_codon:yes stop_codon:yes gene_type:complete